MCPAYVPVTMGSPRYRTVELDGLRVTEAWFPPHAVLPPHIHERPILCAMLRGSFDVAFRSDRFACTRDTAHVEPLGERHANYVGTAGAHVVVIQPDPARDEMVRPLRGALQQITARRDADIADRANRIAAELAAADDLTPLSVAACALEMLALAARRGLRASGSPPAWLARAEDYLRAYARTPVRLADVAREAGVNAAHLTRTFRRHFRTTVAAYLRRARLEWAAARLLASDDALARIALEAGFNDQSHFTRAFRGWAGTTPARYRAARRRETRTPPEPSDGV